MNDAPSPPAPTQPPRTRDPRAIALESQALGVPADYGRSRGLKRQREPAQLEFIGRDINGREQWLVPPAARAYQRMIAAATRAGIAIQLVSGFRSAEYQLVILKRKLARGDQIDDILRAIAAPGYSEHHTGRAVDLTTPGCRPAEPEFEESAAFAWLNRYAGDFGFRLSFPRENPHGIAYEPWHWCYVRGLGRASGEGVRRA
jgi:D-alanyl-D-alanine carboxypeptidase